MQWLQNTQQNCRKAMLFDELRMPDSHRVFSTTLPYGGKDKGEKEVLIEPWSSEAVQNVKGKEVRRLRVHTMERGCSKQGKSDRKRSVDERIVEMYRKYGGEGSVMGETYEPKSANSRQIYRQKLREFEKGSEFRQLGRKGELEEGSMDEPLQMVSLRLANVYCCDYKGPKIDEQTPKKAKGEYKYNDKFQRMLKIRDKIRRKNSLAVSKQKQKFQSEYESGGWTTVEREPGFAKATLERNRLKLRLRGLSKEQLKEKGQPSKQQQVKGQFCRIQKVGTYSGAFQTAMARELLDSGRVGRLNRTQGYFSH